MFITWAGRRAVPTGGAVVDASALPVHGADLVGAVESEGAAHLVLGALVLALAVRLRDQGVEDGSGAAAVGEAVGALGRGRARRGAVDAGHALGHGGAAVGQGADLVRGVVGEGHAVGVLGTLRLAIAVDLGDEAGQDAASAAAGLETVLTD